MLFGHRIFTQIEHFRKRKFEAKGPSYSKDNLLLKKYHKLILPKNHIL
jgi:hypothetical protein